VGLVEEVLETKAMVLVLLQLEEPIQEVEVEVEAFLGQQIVEQQEALA